MMLSLIQKLATDDLFKEFHEVTGLDHTHYPEEYFMFWNINYNRANKYNIEMIGKDIDKMVKMYNGLLARIETLEKDKDGGKGPLND